MFEYDLLTALLHICLHYALLDTMWKQDINKESSPAFTSVDQILLDV